MTSYLVRMSGRNVLVNSDSSPKKRRFSATRLVEAGNLEEAQTLAVERTQKAVQLEVDILNDPSDPPSIKIERVDEVRASTFDTQRRSASIYWHEEKPEA